MRDQRPGASGEDRRAPGTKGRASGSWRGGASARPRETWSQKNGGQDADADRELDAQVPQSSRRPAPRSVPLALTPKPCGGMMPHAKRLLCRPHIKKLKIKIKIKTDCRFCYVSLRGTSKMSLKKEKYLITSNNSQ